MRRRSTMKSLVSMIVALGLAVAFTGTAFAATKAPTTQAACEKAKMTWDAATKKCTKGKM
jgi:GH24 family phage-related lysozyme (muramidase)